MKVSEHNDENVSMSQVSSLVKVINNQKPSDGSDNREELKSINESDLDPDKCLKDKLFVASKSLILNSGNDNERIAFSNGLKSKSHENVASINESA